MSLVVGFDCGGSSTRSLVLETETGRPVFEGRGAAASWSQTPRADLRRHLQDALAGSPAVEAAAGCFAGLLTPEDKAEAEQLLSEVLPSAKVGAYADYAGALSAAPPDTTCLIIAGTGSLVCSLGPTGDIDKTSGGGPLLTGDPGSVYTICRKALTRLLENPLSTEFAYLWPTVEAAFGSTDPDEITSTFYSDPQRASRTCTLITAIAEREAPASALGKQTFLANELMSLALFLMSHLERFGLSGDRAKVALAGGLWSVNPRLKRVFDRQLDNLMQLVRGDQAAEASLSPGVRSKVRDRVSQAINTAVDDLRADPDPEVYEGALNLAGTLRFWLQAFEKAEALDEFEVRLSPKYLHYKSFETFLLNDSPALGAARLAAKLLP